MVAVTIIHRNKLPLSFIAFVKAAAPFAAAPFAAVQLLLASAYVFFVLS